MIGERPFKFIRIVIVFIMLITLFLTTIFIEYSNKLQPHGTDRNMGSSKTLEGNCLFIVVFLSDEESSFNEEEKQNRFILLGEALDFLGEKAECYNKSFEPIFNNPDIVIDYKVNFNIPIYGETDSDWESDILPDIFSKHNIKETIKNYAPDNVSIVYFLNKTGIPYAISSGSRGIDEKSIKKTEKAVITTYWKDMNKITSSAYAHEILHLFGADDLYYKNDAFHDLEVLSKELFPYDIMRNTLRDDISVFELNEIDAYAIGWIDELKEEYHIFLDFNDDFFTIFLDFNNDIVILRIVLFLIICILGIYILIIVCKRIYNKNRLL